MTNRVEHATLRTMRSGEDALRERPSHRTEILPLRLTGSERLDERYELAEISIAVMDPCLFTRECISCSLQAVNGERRVRVLPFASIDDMQQAEAKIDVILYHLQYREQEAGLAERHALQDLKEVAPIIVLSGIDEPETVYEALRQGARAYVSTQETTVEQFYEIIRLVMAGGIFIPKTGLPLDNRSASRPERPGNEAISIFTPREKSVLTLLKRGKSNKIIAHELGMSHSTVKVHVRNIMRKLKVRNRTQAVYLAYTTRLM